MLIKIDCSFQARHKLADSKVGASTAEKQRVELEAQLEHSRAELASLKSQHTESQQSHEEELQSLRHTMQLVSEQMRTAQKEFDASSKASAAKLSALKADSEQKTEELAHQLGKSDFALRQLRGQLETAMSIKEPDQVDAQQQDQHRHVKDAELEALTQELNALKEKHESALSRHESSLTEHDDAVKEHLATNAQLKEGIAAMQAQMSQQQLAQSSAKAAADDHSQLVRQLAELKEQLISQASAASKQDTDSQHSRAALCEELDAAKAEHKQLEQSVLDLQTQLDQSRQQV